MGERKEGGFKKTRKKKKKTQNSKFKEINIQERKQQSIQTYKKKYFG